MNEIIIVRNDFFKIGRSYQICLLCIIVLAVYYPAIFAEISLLDDLDAITSLLNIESFSLKSIFLPGGKEGGYYRPFIGISYMIDRFWWFLDSKIMHFENILMHLFNTIMVFFTAISLYKTEKDSASTLPLFTAVLFALHPINTESINWISGRTDAMACMFVLSSLLLLLKYRENGSKLLLLCAYAVALLGILAKETALGFIPGSVFILLALPRSLQVVERPDFDSSDSRRSDLVRLACYTVAALLVALVFVNYFVVVFIGVIYWGHSLIVLHHAQLTRLLFHKIRSFLMVAGSCVLLMAIYQGVRKVVFASDVSKIASTVKVMMTDMNYTIELFMGAAGFYMKKFFFPLPLNIAIREIDPLYSLLGVICFLGCIYFVQLRSIEAAFIITGFFMVVPTLPLAFGTIAWTGYAERYVYIPSAFWILGGIGFIRSATGELWRPYLKIIAMLVVIFFATITLKRNITWQNNVTLFKDAVEKSPDFINVRGIYISALYDKKMYDEAERQYFIAKKLYSMRYDEKYDIIYAKILCINKKYDTAEKLYNDIEYNTKGKSVLLYEEMSTFYRNRESSESDICMKKVLTRKKLEALNKLYILNKLPATGYRLGQEYFEAGEIAKSKDVFEKVIKQSRDDEPLKYKAKNMLNKINNVGI
ncbi:glycosyltransferase family 39 protein [Trichlorobacter lovleyi]|uniref:tetratricopeptide repeat protein n=1 Tax=Trichlorobacter lovleyi TaxID=313985 RepID=UPI00223EFC1C|nr:glycosyltransferase family 39 protein [Trichlorobacter lovleyi]QOX79157.1 glycosyltransferase family 39 protein [Trichlorobacter lovleyi]